MLLQLGRSADLKGSERSAVVVDLLSFDSEKELAADEVGKVSLLVRVDAIVVVHREDGLMQKNASVEELRKPTGARPESSDPRMKTALAMGATAMLYFFFRETKIAALQKRSRPTVVTSQKDSRRGGDLLSFDSEKELVAPSLQSTERRWAVALTGALGRENKGCRRDDADERV
ncbi:hypothetical protein BHE74_00048588 [Ensete ventricosum]|nr:hypothetical protein BHE74_00048588 [Ensete ventricosum]